MFFRGCCGKTIFLPCFPQYFLQHRRNKTSLEWFSVLETSSYIYMIWILRRGPLAVALPSSWRTSESSFYGLNPVIKVIKVKVIKVIRVFQSDLILNGHPLNLRFYYKLFIIMRKIKEIIIRIKRKYSKPSQQLYKRIMWVALSKSIWTINYKNLNFQSHSFNTYVM